MTSYEGPIVDAHQHFWQPELGRQPWLAPEAKIDFRYGDYSSIKRSYLPPDLLADAAGFNVVATVTMETEWDQDDPVGEMRYTKALADQYGLPNAAVAHAVLRDPGVAATIEQLAAIDLVRSVRDKPGQAPSPAQARQQPSLLTDPAWQRGYAVLARSGLTFDLQVAWWHLPEAAALAKQYPEQMIIINHAGLPADRSPAMMRGWAENVRLMAELPNTVMKVSGIGIPQIPWRVANNRIIVETIAECFGPDRMMFASNFPVDSLCGSYADIFGGFIEICREWSATEQLAAFAGTAVRTYRLNPELLSAPGLG